MLVGFLCPNFVRPMTEGVAENNDVTVNLVDRHLHAQCLICLQPPRNVIPGQTLAIGYGGSRVALGRSISFKLQQTPAFKWVNISQLSGSSLFVQMKCSTRVW